MRRHQADRLGEIHRRAAADGDDAVAALVLVDLQRVAHRGFGRILRRAVIDRDRHVAGQLLLHLGPQAGGDHALVGDDQRPAHAEQLQLGLEQFQRAEIELDAREIGDERHGRFLRAIERLVALDRDAVARAACAGSSPTSRDAGPRGCPRRRSSWAARRSGTGTPASRRGGRASPAAHRSRSCLRPTMRVVKLRLT